MGNKSCCYHAPELDFTDKYKHASLSPYKKLNSNIQVSPYIQQMVNRLKPLQSNLPQFPQQTKIGNDIYQGQIDHKGNPEGYGKLHKQNGCLLIGEFKHGKIKDNQEGYYFMADGSYYFGKFIDNKANDSEGKYYSGSFIYKGGFKNNRFHGFGKEKNLDYQFQGQYEEDARKQGVFVWREHDVEYRYTGGFNQNQQFQGEGELEQPSGKYVGTFKDGKKHGKGQYIYRNKLRYEGEYKNGLKQGFGTIYNANNQKSYEGQWLNDLPSGKGTSINKNGTIVQSEFFEGIDVNCIDKKYLKKEEKRRQKAKAKHEYIETDSSSPSIILK